MPSSPRPLPGRGYCWGRRVHETHWECCQGLDASWLLLPRSGASHKEPPHQTSPMNSEGTIAHFKLLLFVFLYCMLYQKFQQPNNNRQNSTLPISSVVCPGVTLGWISASTGLQDFSDDVHLLASTFTSDQFFFDISGVLLFVELGEFTAAPTFCHSMNFFHS